MSSRATSVRPPYISIRARALSSATSPVSKPSTSGEVVSLPNSSSVVTEVSEHASMAPAVIASFSSIFTPRSNKHMYSLPSSASSSSDSLSLPLATSPKQAAFGTEIWEEDGHFRTGGRPTPKETLPWGSGSLSSLLPMIFIILLFPLSTIVVISGVLTLPITASFPRTLSELADLARDLQTYSTSGFQPKAHVLGVLALTTLWKHAWSIPGSVLLNVLSGVLLPSILATLFMTSLTAVGSLLSTLLSTPLAPIISHLFPRVLSLTRNALEGDITLSSREKSPVWVRLSVLRLIGVVPWSGINIASGVASVTLTDCVLGAFIGTLPWTAVTVQIGDILQTVASTTATANSETLTSILRSPNVVMKLAILTIVSLVPILVRDRLKSLIGRMPEQLEVEEKIFIAKDIQGKRWSLKHWRIRSITKSEADGLGDDTTLPEKKSLST
ncbi:hypothetical protein Clacol_001824 [Clathrus columnatus]|uniref:VTT domain-containing protein n=1 Tax=Clathrus columnatus TaxID=1419009 RepID=A0AAV5A070_9AGAM|nr:hypothetical protein Clacol_001824 [Clathrus columnatus]